MTTQPAQLVPRSTFEHGSSLTQVTLPSLRPPHVSESREINMIQASFNFRALLGTDYYSRNFLSTLHMFFFVNHPAHPISLLQSLDDVWPVQGDEVHRYVPTAFPTDTAQSSPFGRSRL